jgi:hypothetical protein
LKHRPTPFISADSRISFVDHNPVYIFGLKAGISYNKKLRFGLGYNQLYNPPKNLDQDIQYINSLGKPYIITKGLKLFYFSAVADYTFYSTKHWELSMPLQIGIGNTYYQSQLNGYKEKTDEHLNFIYEPTISIDYKITKWFGIAVDYGYRFFISNNHKLNQQLNSTIVTGGLSIYYSEIYKSLFPHTKLAQKL